MRQKTHMANVIGGVMGILIIAFFLLGVLYLAWA